MKRALRLPALGPGERVHTSRYPLGATTLVPSLRAGRAFRRNPLAFLEELGAREPVFRFTVGFSEHVLVNSPALIQRVLVDDNDRFGEGKWTQRGHFVMGDCLITREGAPHRERRAVLRPAFTRAGIQASAAAMVDCVERLEARWRDGETRDLRDDMAEVALTSAARALFDADLEKQAGELVAAIRLLLRAISRLPIPSPRLRAAERLLQSTAARLRGGPLRAALSEAGLDEDAIRDEIVSILLASVDTTPNTLMWAWFEIGRHPEVEARLHRELDEVLAGERPDAENVGDLAYLKLVISETLRLHPPVHFIDRRALADMDLDGFPVREAEYVLLSPLLTQRDPRYFPEPAAFRPERFAPEARGAMPRFAYFPFGAGPHVCIGMNLADLEMSLVLASLAQRWRLVPDPSLPADPGLYPASLPSRLVRRP